MGARYLVALGSNVCHVRHGAPAKVLAAAFEALRESRRIKVMAVSPVYSTAPMGPSRRRFANACAMIETPLGPARLLRRLQRIESEFGRNRRNRRWGPRVLDLDIVLWSEGACVAENLVVPHRAFRQRAFVLRPALAIAPSWRDPVTGLRIRHLYARLTRPVPVRN